MVTFVDSLRLSSALPFLFMSAEILYVDPNRGNNASAQRGLSTKPFATITAAVRAAIAADTVYVLPGTYKENNLMKAGISIHFMPGAKIVYQDPGTGPGYGIFDDRAPGAAGGTFVVSGSLEITYRNSGNTINPNLNCRGAVVIQDATTKLNFEGKRITISQPTFNAIQCFAAFCIFACADGSMIACDEVTDTFETWTDPGDGVTTGPGFAMGVYWGRGDLHVNIHRNTMAANYCFWCEEPSGNPATNCWYRGHLMQTREAGALACFYVSGPVGANSVNYRIWCDCLEILAASVAVNTIIKGAKVYLNAQKVQGTNAFICQGVELWATVAKISASTQWATHSAYTGISKDVHYTVQHFEDIGSVANGIQNQLSGSTLYIHGGLLKNGASGLVLVSHESGRTRLIGCELDATANNTANNRPIVTSAPDLRLVGCTILTSASATASIYAAAARTVKFTGTTIATKAVDPNVTQQPVSSVVVDASAGP